VPELPDVANLKRYFDATALGRTVARSSITDGRILGGASAELVARRLKGRRFEGTHRHGKFLFASISGDGWLVLHFGMTGELKLYKEEADRPRHARLVVDFEDGFHLAFVCVRLLGLVSITDDVEEFLQDRGVGPDALGGDLDLERFLDIFQGRRGAVKGALLKQSLVAGIGNVYADEILFQTGVRPDTKMNRLSGGELETLYRNLRVVLEKAAAPDESLDELPRGSILPHRGADGTCPRCSAGIRRMKVAGRSSYYCPKCQRKRG